MLRVRGDIECKEPLLYKLQINRWYQQKVRLVENVTARQVFWRSCQRLDVDLIDCDGIVQYDKQTWGYTCCECDCKVHCCILSNKELQYTDIS